MKTSLIIQESKQIKQFIEKNKSLPQICTINGNEYSIYTTSYLLGKFLQNTKKTSINVKTIGGYNTQANDKINEKILPNDYLDMNNRFIKYCETNKKVPSYITTKKSKTKVSYELFVYCLCKIITFYSNNSKTLPAYCTFNSSDIKFKQTTKKTTQKTTKTSTSSVKKTTKKTTATTSDTKKTTQQTTTTSTSSVKKTTKKTNCTNPYTSSPHYMQEGCNKLGQCTGYYCAPHSIHQAIKKLGITKYTEKQIAGWAGTTTGGTGHPGINTAIAKIAKESGVNLKVQWKNFSDMGNSDKERFENIGKLLCKSNVAIIWHILYINGGASVSGKGFGHYEYVDKINTSTHYVRALNSLGDKKTDGSYKGRLQDRAYSIQAHYARNTNGGQPALCIITKG